MLNIYQNNSIKDANKPNAAETYWSVEYLWTKLEVWYKIEPAARTIIPTENQSPRLKPNNKPATIKPMAIKKPIVKKRLINEKSFLVKSTIADKPVNNDKVKIAACLSIKWPPSMVVAIYNSGIKIKASAIIYRP